MSGSLQASSSNGELLERLRDVAPVGAVRIFDGLGDVPLFNPDVDGDPAHPAVALLRSLVQDADAIVFATPEYAHGVPGCLKNALDWLVGSGELYGKPVIVLSAVPIAERGVRARDQLVQTLRAQGADVLAAEPIVSKGPDHEPEQVDAALRRVLALAADRSEQSASLAPPAR